MLEDAGLENFIQLFAEAIVSGSLPLDSFYATKLSDSAVNINRPKSEGFRYHQVYKLVCALGYKPAMRMVEVCELESTQLPLHSSCARLSWRHPKLEPCWPLACTRLT